MYEVAWIRIGGAFDELLQRQLDHRVEAALEVDHPLAVLERSRDALIGRSAGDLVDDVEADPDRELEHEVRPAAWQPTCRGF